MGNINLSLEGYSNQVIESMIESGFAKTKSEALRLALYEFDRSHHLVPNEEVAFALVAKDILNKVEEGREKVKPFSLSEL